MGQRHDSWPLPNKIICLPYPLFPIEAMASHASIPSAGMASAICDHDNTPSCLDNLSTPPPHFYFPSALRCSTTDTPPLSSFNASPFINHHALLVFPAAKIQCSTPPTVIFTTPVEPSNSQGCSWRGIPVTVSKIRIPGQL